MLFNVVKLFCFGDCTDYIQSKAEIGYELNPAEINKLQLLSLISLASQVTYMRVGNVLFWFFDDISSSRTISNEKYRHKS